MSKLKDSKIYVVGTGKSYANWMLGTVVDTMEESDFVVFTGGEDVSPAFYGHAANPRTRTNPLRDVFEKKEFDKAQQLGKKCVGICRGSQFLCAMSGGKLVQHQDNPLFSHNIKTYTGDEFEITSTHHQAQYPFTISKDYQGRDNYLVIAWTEGISAYHENGLQEEMPLPNNKECEIVYYKNTNCLGIQGHPEMMFNKEHYKESITKLQAILNKFLYGYYKLVLNRNPKLQLVEDGE